MQTLGEALAVSWNPTCWSRRAPHEVLFCPLRLLLCSTLLGRLGEALDRGAELRCPAHQARGLGALGAADRSRRPLGGNRRHRRGLCRHWSDDVMAAAGYTLPMVDHEARGSAAVGYLAYTQPMAVRLRRVLTTPRLNVRHGRRAAGCAKISTWTAHRRLPCRSRPTDRLLRSFSPGCMGSCEAASAPSWKRFGWDSARSRRTASPSPGGSTTRGASTSSPHTAESRLAPLLARLAADEIVGDTDEELLAPVQTAAPRPPAAGRLSVAARFRLSP